MLEREIIAIGILEIEKNERAEFIEQLLLNYLPGSILLVAFGFGCLPDPLIILELVDLFMVY